MSRSAMLTGLMATVVAAQAPFASDGFKYVGCVSADPANFPVNIAFVQPFTPDQCQSACAGKASYAALGGGCHCDDPADKAHQPPMYTVVDESKCNLPCIGNDPSKGYCGGQPGIYNLYKKGGDPVKTVTEPCEDDVKKKWPKTTIKTVIDCPPEVTDCPARRKKFPQCPPGCIPKPVDPKPKPVDPKPKPIVDPLPCLLPEGCDTTMNIVPSTTWCPDGNCDPTPIPLPTPDKPCPPEICPPKPQCPDYCIPAPTSKPIPPPESTAAAVTTTEPPPITTDLPETTTPVTPPVMSTTTPIVVPTGGSSVVRAGVFSGAAAMMAAVVCLW